MADMAMAAAAAAGYSRLPERPGGRGRGRGGGGGGRGGGRGRGGRGGGHIGHHHRSPTAHRDAAEIALDDDADTAACEYWDDEDGPNVDDLEVAAAAAAEAQAALDRVTAATAAGRPQGVASGPGETPISQEAGDGPATTSDEEDGDPGHTSGGMGGGSGPGAPATRVRVSLAGSEGGRVAVGLAVVDPAAAVAMDEDDADEDDTASSSDNDSEIFEPAQLREIVDRLQADAVDSDDDGGGGGRPLTGAEALGLPPDAAPLTDVAIGPDDAVTPAGAIASLVEEMIVVQAPANTHTLSEGAVLCLADRTPLGRVEDVFGPVSEPLYALRCPAKELPGGAVPGAAVFSVDKYAAFVQAAALKVKGYDVYDAADEEEPEFTFSDDEAEAAYLRDKAAAATRPAVMTQAPSHARGPRPHRGGGRGYGSRGGGGWAGGGRGVRPPNAVQAALDQARPVLPAGFGFAAIPPGYGGPPPGYAPQYAAGPASGYQAGGPGQWAPGYRGWGGAPHPGPHGQHAPQ